MGSEGSLEEEQHRMERVRYKPAMWSFPATRVAQMLSPRLCSKQMEPHSVTKIDCSDVVLIKRQPGRSRLHVKGPAT